MDNHQQEDEGVAMDEEDEVADEVEDAVDRKLSRVKCFTIHV